MASSLKSPRRQTPQLQPWPLYPQHLRYTPCHISQHPLSPVKRGVGGVHQPTHRQLWCTPTCASATTTTSYSAQIHNNASLHSHSSLTLYQSTLSQHFPTPSKLTRLPATTPTLSAYRRERGFDALSYFHSPPSCTNCAIRFNHLLINFFNSVWQSSRHTSHISHTSQSLFPSLPFSTAITSQRKDGLSLWLQLPTLPVRRLCSAYSCLPVDSSSSGRSRQTSMRQLK
ncbi:hypothetical protein TcWFU_007731 [Taenia crassiceps]|uniref:Uncharacterized protein n=1 Tax=Taenia crassiceps TaxID=6207 RepID=A0ABR4Q5V8_9CEST